MEQRELVPLKYGNIIARVEAITYVYGNQMASTDDRPTKDDDKH